MHYKICLYEDWMREQVIDLFCLQYDKKKEQFNKTFENFYEHPFQKNHTIRIVALDDKKVVGFQSFFYWPYQCNNKIFNSFQSGNSLVHPYHRGKGIFQQLLNFIYENNKHLKIDFLMGFPVEASINSFIKNNWVNLLNLKWFVKINNIFSFIFFFQSTKKIAEVFNGIPLSLTTSFDNTFRLISNDLIFQWRAAYSYNNKYYYYTFQEGDEFVQFELKYQKRKKIINELIIGDIRTNSKNIQILKNAFEALVKKTKSIKFITILSIAINSQSSFNIINFLKKLNFKKNRKEIYFIIKNFMDSNEVEKIENWILYRSDIDTW